MVLGCSPQPATSAWNTGGKGSRGTSGRKFLGYSFWVAAKGRVNCKVAGKPLAAFKQRVRQLTRRLGGRSMQDVVEKLRAYLLGWQAYYKLAQTPGVWRKLDEWLRHRLRAIQLSSGNVERPCTANCASWARQIS